MSQRGDAVPAEESAPESRPVAPVQSGSTPPRELLISFEDDDPKVAILEHGRVVGLELDPPQGRRIVGNIYKGRVQNVLPGMQAAFVDIGLDRNAFLFVDDAHPGSALDAGEDAPDEAPPRSGASITDLVRSGQEILVQVVKEPIGTKGARISRGLSLPGRFLVLMPGLDYVGISRRIAAGAERERLRAAAGRVRPAGTGLIVRTAAEGVAEGEIEADWRLLTATWQDLMGQARRAKAPAVVYRDLDVVRRVVRDQLSGEVAVVVDRPEQIERIAALLHAAAPTVPPRLAVATPQEMRQGLFAARGVDAEIECALARRVPLPSGGYLVIDHTEALTAIDVNTGRYVGEAASARLADTFLTTNLEAASEIARQLRLRDTGGIIVVDFIDMEPAEHRRRVLSALETACAPDHARPQVLGITALGLVEMTRKKARQSLRELLTTPCPQCDGHGRVRLEDTTSQRLRRDIRQAVRGTPAAEAFLIEVHPSIASILIGQGGESLRALEQQTGRLIYIRGAADCRAETMRVRASGSRREIEAQARPVHEGQVLELQVQEMHATSALDGIARVDGYVVDIEGGAACVGQRVKVEITKTFRTYAKARRVPSPAAASE